MDKLGLALILPLALVIPAIARSADAMLFWNLTGIKIAKLYLAPSESGKWGPDQCAKDPDGSVDPDERLRLTGVTAGRLT